MTKTKFAPDQKIQIVLESMKTGVNTAELCRKHNVHPQTLQSWRQKFMDGGKPSLSSYGKNDPISAAKKEHSDQTDRKRVDYCQRRFKKKVSETEQGLSTIRMTHG